MPELSLDTFDREVAAAEQAAGASRAQLMVCHCTTCLAAGAAELHRAIEHEIEAQGQQAAVAARPTGASAFCAMGPVVVAQPAGTFYGGLTPADAAELVAHAARGELYPPRLYHDADGEAVAREADISFVAHQQPVVLRNRSRLDPTDIRDALRFGAYDALAGLLRRSEPGQAIIDAIARSGLRGRGGGGFPAGVKWQSAAAAAAERGLAPYIVCNADEGDPGAYMDRSIVEADPHALIEGMCIGALALGAREGFVYIRREYPLALQRLGRALAQARRWGLLGRGILGTDLDFDITVHRGAGAFVCGESTALFASMEGRPGEPRAKYVHSVEYGFRDAPTVLNNVETWANVPQIIGRGPEWFAAMGTGDVSSDPWGGSSGTKVFSLVGNVVHTGLVEVPMGMTLRQIVFDVGGGVPAGRAFKAVQTGGPSGGVLPAEQLDLPVDFDTLQRAGSMMGSGGLIVMDDRTCMVDVAKYFVDFLMDESCGKCTACREGLSCLHEVLDRITRGEGREGDLELLEDLGAVLADGSLCGLGQTAANPVLTTLRYFRDEYEAHIRDRRCPAGVCKALVRYSVDPDKCTGCMLCIKPCPTDCISGQKDQVHAIDQDECIQCGTCLDACPDDAIRVE